ncbi:hypothetical protein TKK_0000420 [Trichogramma kaykai]
MGSLVLGGRAGLRLVILGGAGGCTRGTVPAARARMLLAAEACSLVGGAPDPAVSLVGLLLDEASPGSTASSTTGPTTSLSRPPSLAPLRTGPK